MSIFVSLFCIAFLADATVDHGQGEMAGRVTDTSAILQSRLTQGATLIKGDLPGSPGVARFELATNPEFEESSKTPWNRASPKSDYIVKVVVEGLKPSTKYYYRLLYGPEHDDIVKGRTCSFKTLGGKDAVQKTRFVVVTGMNYFYFHEGKYSPDNAYQGEDKHLGYPALKAIGKQKPDFFVGTGDNVYFDQPLKREGSDRWMGTAWSDRAMTETEMRRKYHEQFVQPRFVELFTEVPTYWEVDDHDYRFDDSDNTGNRMPAPEMGRRIFREQLPVVDPADPTDLTYATFRVSRDLQIWLLEGRYYRSPNAMPDGPDKTIWGEAQNQWLRATLLESDATFKILISPTPLVGPDRAMKGDNHTNLNGFRHERQEFIGWLKKNRFFEKNLYILCGDRHWQYHAKHPSGLEEFSCGALIDANSRLGVKAGSPDSTDPEGKIQQYYCPLEGEPSGGFLMVAVSPKKEGTEALFEFYDEQGALTYSYKKKANDIIHQNNKN
jgi:alkaline phosphatase/alkaline phosphatase D